MLSGKSTALKVFARCGAFVLSPDELVREISARSSVQKKITDLFGKNDKTFLTQKVFHSAGVRKKLENLLHPLVLAEMKKRLKEDKNKIQVYFLFNKFSRISTALLAAPFLILSATHQKLIPFSTLKSRRILPT